MKHIIIIDCGPSFSEVSQQFGYAPEWIIDILKNKKCKFTWIKLYKGETVDLLEAGAWVITGSPYSVYEEEEWMIDMEEKTTKDPISLSPLKKEYTP